MHENIHVFEQNINLTVIQWPLINKKGIIIDLINTEIFKLYPMFNSSKILNKTTFRDVLCLQISFFKKAKSLPEI